MPDDVVLSVLCEKEKRGMEVGGFTVLGGVGCYGDVGRRLRTAAREA
jgi:hypothetical protein